MSYGDYNELEHKRNLVGYMVVAGLVFVASMAMLFVMVWNDHANTTTREQTKRDRIAACVQSNDVVGCLKAAEGAR